MSTDPAIARRYLRQMDICPPDKLEFPITVVGAGAIGSAAVIGLTKMGCSNVTVYDHDILDVHNIPNQFSMVGSLGDNKVKALNGLVTAMGGVELHTREMSYEGQYAAGVLILAVDSMGVRNRVWKHILKRTAKPLLLIDARMGAQVGRVYCVRPDDPKSCFRYEKNLYTDEAATPEPCSARSIIYCPMVMGGYVTALVKKYAMSESIPFEIIFDLVNFVQIVSV